MKILKVKKIDAKWDGMRLWDICRELNDKAPKDPQGSSNGVYIHAPLGKGAVTITISPATWSATPDEIKSYIKFLDKCVKYAEKCYEDLKKAGFDVKYGR